MSRAVSMKKGFRQTLEQGDVAGIIAKEQVTDDLARNVRPACVCSRSSPSMPNGRQVSRAA
jgi:hypothetical protein